MKTNSGKDDMTGLVEYSSGLTKHIMAPEATSRLSRLLSASSFLP